MAITQEASDPFSQDTTTIRELRLRVEELEKRVLDQERESNRYRELHGPLPEEPINNEQVEVGLDNFDTFLDRDWLETCK